MKTVPKDIDELNELRVFARDTLEDELKNLNNRISRIMDRMQLLEEMNYKISFEDFAQTWSIYGLPLKLKKKQAKCIAKLQNLEKVLSDELAYAQDDLMHQVQALGKELELLQKEQDINTITAIATKYYIFGEQLERLIKEAEVVNRRQVILKQQPTDYTELDKISKSFSPYFKVWCYASEYNVKCEISLTGPLSNVDRD